MKAVVRELKAVLKGMRAEAKLAAREMKRVERLLAAAGGGTGKKKRAYKKRAKNGQKKGVKQEQEDESETVAPVRKVKVKSTKSTKTAKRKPGPKPRIKMVEPEPDEDDASDTNIEDEGFIERKRERLAKIRGRAPSQNSGTYEGA